MEQMPKQALRWFLGLVIWPTASIATAVINYNDCKVAAGGSQGKADNQLDVPHGVTVDASGDLLVVDNRNDRIMWWPANASEVANTVGIQVAGGSTTGSSLSQLDRPKNVIVRSDGTLLITDSNNYRIMKWSPGAASGTEWAAGLSYKPSGLEEVASGEVFVTSREYDYVQKFPPEGGTGVDWSGPTGTHGGTMDIEFDSEGRMLALLDQGLVRFPAEQDLSGNLVEVGVYSGTGTGLNMTTLPRSIKIDCTGALWISDRDNKRILRCQNGPPGPCELMLDTPSKPMGIAFDHTEQNLYVAESGHYVVVCPTGKTSTTTTTTSTSTTSATSSTTFTTSATSSTTTTTSATSSTTTTVSATSSTTTTTSATSSITTTTSVTSSTTTASATSSATTTTSTSTTSSTTLTTPTSTVSTTLTTSTSTASTTTTPTTTTPTGTSSTTTVSTSTTFTRTFSSTTSTFSNTNTTSATSTATSSTSGTLTTSSTATTTTPPSSSEVQSAVVSTGAPVPSTSTAAEQPSPADVATDLLETVTNVSQALLVRLQGGLEQATVSIPGGTLTAVRLDAPENLKNSSETDGVEVLVATEEGAMEVTIPRTVFEEVPSSSVPKDSLVLVVSALSHERSKDLGGQATDGQGESDSTGDEKAFGPAAELGGLQVLSVVSIDLFYLLSGESVEVGQLEKPIVFQLPGTNYSAGVRCAFWEEDGQLWSYDGVEAPAESNEEGKLVVCHTYHLTIFAAILQSFLLTLQCAQFKLMSREAIRNLFNDDSWLQRPSAWMCWSIFTGLLLVGGISVVMDCKRRQDHCWRDEYFLVAVGANEDDSDDSESGSEEEGSWRPTNSMSKRASEFAVQKGQHCLRCLGASSALREALDEIMSSWCQYWGDVRGACEALAEVITEGGGGTRRKWSQLIHKFIAMLLLTSSRRLAASSMGMTNDAVRFMLEDEDLQEFLTEIPKDTPVGTREVDWKTSEDQRVAWTALHDEVVHHVLDHTRRHTTGHLPRVTLEFFLFHNPLSALFVHDIFHSCKKRALMLAVDLLGALAMSCVFFNAASMVRGKPLRAGQDCTGSNGDFFTYRFGRFLAIAFGSLIVSGLPVTFIESLHTKGFRKVDARGSKAWKRQLRIWATQDMIVWVVSCLYMAFCVFFVLVFLASIGPQDHENWSQTGILVMSEDFLLIPAFVALLVPTMTVCFIEFLGKLDRGGTRTILRRSQETLLRQTSLMTPITRI